jgi:threonine dehydrogenase-like Zn-dependent dehydrogenase
MNDDQKFERAMRMVEEEVFKNPRGLWYLSYADDDGFRGGLYLEAHGPASAALRANMEKLSPGGEVMVIGPVPADKIPPQNFWNRLLTREELQQADPDEEWKTLEELEAEKESE